MMIGKEWERAGAAFSEKFGTYSLWCDVRQTGFEFLKQVLTNCRIWLEVSGAFATRQFRSLNLRGLFLQVGLYCLILCLAVGGAVTGSRIFFAVIYHEMSAMGADVAMADLPAEVETASLRSTMR